MTTKTVSSAEFKEKVGFILEALRQGVIDEVVIEGYPDLYLSGKSSFSPKPISDETDEWGQRINKGYDDSDFY